MKQQPETVKTVLHELFELTTLEQQLTHEMAEWSSKFFDEQCSPSVDHERKQHFNSLKYADLTEARLKVRDEILKRIQVTKSWVNPAD